MRAGHSRRQAGRMTLRIVPTVDHAMQARTKTEAPPFDAERALRLARETFAIEADALLGLQRRLTAEFSRAVEAILRCQRRVVVMGMGKSGHVGRKIAA